MPHRTAQVWLNKGGNMNETVISQPVHFPGLKAHSGLLTKRMRVKGTITSATLHSVSFSCHFDPISFRSKPSPRESEQENVGQPFCYGMFLNDLLLFLFDCKLKVSNLLAKFVYVARKVRFAERQIFLVTEAHPLALILMVY
jgi:hypothetical protein